MPNFRRAASPCVDSRQVKVREFCTALPVVEFSSVGLKVLLSALYEDVKLKTVIRKASEDESMVGLTLHSLRQREAIKKVG